MNTTGQATTARPRARSSVVAVGLLLAVPWSVQLFGPGDATMVFLWGLVNTDPPQVTSLYAFLFVFTRGLPEYILAWPYSAGLYGLALASALGGALLGREDVRVTAGLLALAGVVHLWFAVAVSVQPDRTAWPLGTVAVAAVLWLYYRPALAALRP